MKIIWKDSHDEEMYHLGMKTQNGKMICYVSLFCDAVYDLFGDEFYETVKKLNPGEIKQVDISAGVKDG